jgi:hypothetical protein
MKKDTSVTTCELIMACALAMTCELVSPACGTKELSPALQRWVGVCSRPSPVGDCVATSYWFAAVEGITQKPAPNGAKELSPALQRWVKWEI